MTDEVEVTQPTYTQDDIVNGYLCAVGDVILAIIEATQGGHFSEMSGNEAAVDIVNKLNAAYDNAHEHYFGEPPANKG